MSNTDKIVSELLDIFDDDMTRSDLQGVLYAFVESKLNREQIVIEIHNGMFESNANDEELEIRDYDSYDMDETFTDQYGEKYIRREH